MPLYEYACRVCERRFEVLQRMGAGADGVSCPRCGATDLEREHSTFASAAAPGAGALTGGACGSGRFT